MADDATNDFDEIVQSLVDEREQARADGNYDRADAIREKLDDLGIVVMDDDGETSWRREEAE
jgi:cysteinyl-tRNA synthetase